MGPACGTHRLDKARSGPIASDTWRWGVTAAEDLVRAAIAERGPIPFAEVVELALYHPEAGFYASGGRAGRRGDFVTSPEVGPLFGAVVARALDAWWGAAGRPDPWTVVEAGAGTGALARAVLAAGPACAPALRYALVERTAAQRAAHADLLVDPAARRGPVVVSLDALPEPPGPCLVLANELLDNLPFGLLERSDAGWADVHVGVEAGRLVEVLVPASGPDLRATVGARVPHQEAAASWVAGARAVAGPGGRVVVFDYAATTAALARRPWAEWVRTYRAHAPGQPPLSSLGHQDITCEVAVDQLAPPARDRSQADWLRAHGIDALVEEGRRTWRERASIGDLQAIRARSRVTEAEALLDPAGLGGFRVLEWDGG
jgi:SAM-dependent MidA family methyltransferase